ncbi:MAG: DNA-binding protein, partial [Clostridia bacterium]|nr:DNA-binding protein [Clostridia bacterium]
MQVKEIEVSILMDLYKNLLTEKQHTVMEMYYDLDYSLTEIAENEGVTRQGVLDIIKRSKDKLHEFETKLGLYSKFRAT